MTRKSGPSIRHSIGLSMLGYCLLFLWFYPPLCGIEDEQGFVNQAIFWSRGAISAEGAGLSTHLGDLMQIGGRHLPIRHPGRSFTVLPFYLIGGFQAIFLSGMVLHLLMTWLTIATLERLGLDRRFALLTLFHPTLLIYSRTITADAAAGLGLLLCVYALIRNARPTRRDLLLAGLGLGIAATMRHHAAAASVALALTVFARTKSLQETLVFTLATCLAALPLLAFNVFAYGSVIDPFSAGRGLFSVDYLSVQVPFYFEALNLFWPALFISTFYCISQKRLWPISATCLTFLIFLGLYYFHDSTAGRLQTDIVGLRLMQVALPVWLIGYAAMLSKLAGTLNLSPEMQLDKSRLIATLFAISGLCMTTVLFAKHQQRLVDLNDRRSLLIKATPQGGFLLTEGLVNKLVGIYRPRQPEYEPHSVTFHGHRSYNSDVLADRLARNMPVYLVFSPNQPGSMPTDIFNDLLRTTHARKVPTGNDLLQVWQVEQRSQQTTTEPLKKTLYELKPLNDPHLSEVVAP